MTEPITDEIRQILADHARLRVAAQGLGVDSDLYQAGMSSHASVNVMLALEDHFDVEFSNTMLKPSVFESIGSIAAAISQLLPQVSAS